MKLIKVAFMYDFDETISPNYMQEYSLFDVLGMKKEDFWNYCNDLGIKHNMDGTLVYMYTILYFAHLKHIPLTYNVLKEQGKSVQFFKGIETYFEHITKTALSMGIELEHYIISSGLKEIIEGTSVAKKFTRIFASSFAYDENGEAMWPAQAVNFTTKTQYLFRIRKNRLDNLYNKNEVNEYIANRNLLLPYERMVYIGDGFTDVPCMKVVKDKGGVSICVYDPDKEKAKLEAERIFNDKRVNYTAPADYSDNSRLTQILTDILQKIAVDNKLNNY